MYSSGYCEEVPVEFFLRLHSYLAVCYGVIRRSEKIGLVLASIMSNKFNS